VQNVKPAIFSPAKVAIHQERIDAYLKGRQIYPVTMEMDLTQLCTRSCPTCPYSSARGTGLTLEMPLLDRLFSVLGQHVSGLVISGGEPTWVPHFPETVALARAKGFQEIAVISNGSRLHITRVQDALLKYATSIRVSMYDWQEGDSEYFTQTLEKIHHLRNRIAKEGSSLEIGASILTRKEWNDNYSHVGTQALKAGVDWVYFHPFCIDWKEKRPTQADQTGVLEAIEKFRREAPPNSNIQVPYERYNREALFFSKLHGAHFLIQVGADGCNYAGPECKYEADYLLVDLNKYLKEDFLWHPGRLAALNEMNSKNYRTIGTKHRPPIFSDHIEKIIALNNHSGVGRLVEDIAQFSYPEII
jgi:organic radical activating enzyme